MYSPNRPEYTPEPPEQELTLTLPPNWEHYSQPEKLQYLTQLSLTKKYEILSIPTPTDNSDSALRARHLLNQAADSIINQTIKINEIQFHNQSTTLLQELTQQIKNFTNSTD